MSPSVATGNSECGTVETAESLRDRQEMVASGQWDQARRFLNSNAERGGLMFVAMTMHVIRYDDGSEGLPQERVDQCIEDLNANVPQTGLIFFQEGPTIYHDDSDLAESEYEDFCTIVNTDPVPNTVNCYFIPVYEGLCGVASFPSSNCQGVTTANGCAATVSNHSTFTHEVGHYFNLRHTHSGWGGGECVDGSNCASAGDGFCDTPADPNLSGVVDWDTCDYVGDELDICGSGLPYDPDTTNIMSYSTKPCRDFLSSEQQSMIAWTALNNQHRTDELRSPGACCLPSGCMITAASACDGTWIEGATDCLTKPCGPTGGCCIAESCVVTSESFCEGTWLGEDTTCFDDPCAPYGACCIGTACLELQAGDCNGNWLGAGTTCQSSDPCEPPPTGACCVGFTCSVQTQGDCDGNWLGENSTCTDDPCAPPPTGACCVQESCSIVTESSCLGDWLGADTTCQDDPCATPQTLTVPGQYATVLEALAAATSGDTILVGPGTWTGTGAYVFNPLGRRITIRSAAGPQYTVFDGQGVRRVIRCAAGETSDTVIEGFTITGGVAADGAGIEIDNASHPTFINCVITGNIAQNNGGGVHCSGGSNPTFENCQILNNNCTTSGGGLRIEDSSSPTMMQCTIAQNAATAGGGLAIVGASSAPMLIDVVVSNNTSLSFGGGVFCDTASLTMYGSTVQGNHSDVVGGGMLLRTTASTLTSCLIAGNTAERGAGLYAFQGNPSLTQCTIQTNTASVAAGGVLSQSSGMTMDDCVISGNVSPIGGGGLVAENTPVPTLSNTSVCHNRPSQAEGTWTDGGGNSIQSRCDSSCMDVDGDADVDTADLVILVGYWGQQDAICDLDGSGQVEMSDLLLMLEDWGDCPTTP
ncbi:MAG: right-handed parallel beta-helix repeat-containing protein [Phycisphaerales bacterium]|nr:right-handed parallel beta-helix repeat-containing protein [Phycisphaerales bacterium]